MNAGNVTHKPQQARSQQKLERILAAAREVVSEQGFELTTINEITARAGVAVGTFYTRFENKDALLHALHAQQTEGAAGRLAIELHPDRWVGVPIADVLSTLVTRSMEETRSIAGFQRACYQRALSDPVFAERELAVRRLLSDQLKRLLLRDPSEIRHPNPERAIQFCCELYVSVLTEHINAESFSASPLTDAEVVQELVDTLCSYLRVERPADQMT